MLQLFLHSFYAFLTFQPFMICWGCIFLAAVIRLTLALVCGGDEK